MGKTNNNSEQSCYELFPPPPSPHSTHLDAFSAKSFCLSLWSWMRPKETIMKIKKGKYTMKALKVFFSPQRISAFQRWMRNFWKELCLGRPINKEKNRRRRKTFALQWPWSAFKVEGKLRPSLGTWKPWRRLPNLLLWQSTNQWRRTGGRKS